MSTLSAWRQSARALLPGACFLRRDQQLRALFVTDYPRRNADSKEAALSALSENGFSVTEENGLWLVDLSKDAQLRYLSSLPAPCIKSDLPIEISSLCRSLLSHGVTPNENQPWEAVKRTLIRLDAKETSLLIPELRALTAQYNRLHTPLPTAIVSILNTQEDNLC